MNSEHLKHHHVPHRASTIAMYIFLASLTMLFIGGIFGYVLIRTNWGSDTLGTIKLPNTLFISTALLLAGSVTIHLSLNAIRHERRDAFRMFLVATLIFAGLFIIVQTPAMHNLYQTHLALQKKFEAEAATRPVTQPSNHAEAIASPHDVVLKQTQPFQFYALVMVMILIHALHVVGGIVALGIVSYNAYHNKYDHEQHRGVSNCVLYWHFLDAIWIFMFVVLAGFG